MSNYNPTTGIRYGVISGNSLDPDVLDELFYGSDAKDLSYEYAANELKKDLASEADDIEERVAIMADEVDHNMPEADRESFIERQTQLAYEEHGYPDRESFIDGEFETRCMHIEIDQAEIEGELDGVRYLIGYLGGAVLLWVLESPFLTCADLCSPCVPNAGSLDSLNPEGFECYDVPNDWRQDGCRS